MLDLTNNDNYPKTLLIRNHEGGMIWQVYHVQQRKEAVLLAEGAKRNYFEAVTLIDYNDEYKENWPDWREKCTSKLKEIVDKFDIMG